MSAPSPSATDTLDEPLGAVTQLATSLFQSLSSQSHAGKPTEPPPPLSAFLSAEHTLARALTQTAAHQRRQDFINRLVAEIHELDRRWREVVEGVEKGRRELQDIVKEGEERLVGIKKARQGESYADHRPSNRLDDDDDADDEQLRYPTPSSLPMPSPSARSRPPRPTCLIRMHPLRRCTAHRSRSSFLRFPTKRRCAEGGSTWKNHSVDWARVTASNVSRVSFRLNRVERVSLLSAVATAEADSGDPRATWRQSIQTRNPHTAALYGVRSGLGSEP